MSLYSDDEYFDNLERENISLASFSKRMSAFVIDDLLLGIVIIIAFLDIMSKYSNIELIIQHINQNLIYVLLFKFLYHTMFTWYYGQSIGKMIMKIRVIDLDLLDSPTLLHSSIRAIGRLVFEFFFYIGFLFFFISPIRQTLHDKIGRVVVVNDA
jgi:uncharacterized RDD family membrane protein YckC